MKRPMTLVSGILGLVAHAIVLIFTAIVAIGVFPLLGGADFAAILPLLLMVVASLAISIVGLIFNILTITKWNKAHEVYAKKGKLIVAIIFNFLGIVAAFLMISIVFAVILMLVLVAAAVLAIVDICLENKRTSAPAKTNEEA